MFFLLDRMRSDDSLLTNDDQGEYPAAGFPTASAAACGLPAGINRGERPQQGAGARRTFSWWRPRKPVSQPREDSMGGDFPPREGRVLPVKNTGLSLYGAGRVGSDN